MFEPSIIPECYADTLLVKFLGYEVPNHQHSIGQVAKLMREQPHYKNGLAIGVVDNDKNTPNYFDTFSTVSDQHDIIIKHKEGTQHYLVVLKPAFDNWILKTAEQARVNPPATVKEFRKIAKKFDVGKNPVMLEFLNDIRQNRPVRWQALSTAIDDILKGRLKAPAKTAPKKPAAKKVNGKRKR